MPVASRGVVEGFGRAGAPDAKASGLGQVLASSTSTPLIAPKPEPKPAPSEAKPLAYQEPYQKPFEETRKGKVTLRLHEADAFTSYFAKPSAFFPPAAAAAAAPAPAATSASASTSANGVSQESELEAFVREMREKRELRTQQMNRLSQGYADALCTVPTSTTTSTTSTNANTATATTTQTQTTPANLDLEPLPDAARRTADYALMEEKAGLAMLQMEQDQLLALALQAEARDEAEAARLKREFEQRDEDLALRLQQEFEENFDDLQDALRESERERERQAAQGDVHRGGAANPHVPIAQGD